MSEDIFPPNRAWGLKTHLTLEESIYIALGFDPMVQFDNLPSDIKSQYYTLEDVLKGEIEGSVAWAEIEEENKPTPIWPFTNHNTTIRRHPNNQISEIIVSAKVIATWFNSHGYSWPFDTSGHPISLPQPEVKKELDPRQKYNYLRLIAALMEMAKLPESGASAAIEAQLLSMGFESPKERTIGTIISEIKKLDRD